MLAGLKDPWARAPSAWSEMVERHGGYALSLCEQRPDVPLPRALADRRQVTLAQLDALLSDDARGPFLSVEPVRAPLESEVQHPGPVAHECWRSGRPLLSVGSRGAQELLRVDSDYSHGLHLVVTGSRRFFLFSPDAAAFLQPELDLGGVPFHAWGLEERRRLASRARGLEQVVSAGDALFVPKNWWVHVEYLHRSVGMSWRFGRSPAQNLLSLVVKRPILEILQLADTLESGRTGNVRWAVDLLDLLCSGGDEERTHARLVDFLQRSHQMRVPPQHRHHSSLYGASGFDVFRQVVPPAGRPRLRLRSSPAFDFLSPDLSLDALQVMGARTLAEEVRDHATARATFVLDLWPWPEVPADAPALRLTIAGLRDATRYQESAPESD
ncbi:MAG TPA: cupin-like domain-containing protein [Myxococcales bacterium]|nr:cupin-like domain-containing protein [Myxococcales bacterium]